jgi:FMN-dependent NADH-azoreductase
MKLLQINGSARRVEQGALSTLLANELSAALLAARPGSRATVRDLAVQPHPHWTRPPWAPCSPRPSSAAPNRPPA